MVALRRATFTPIGALRELRYTDARHLLSDPRVAISIDCICDPDNGALWNVDERQIGSVYRHKNASTQSQSIEQDTGLSRVLLSLDDRDLAAIDSHRYSDD